MFTIIKFHDLHLFYPYRSLKRLTDDVTN